MSKVEVNEIDKQSGSTLTLGGSGTAVTLACGATQTGFGRTGTVDWQTTKKTTAFTAANGEGYFVDTAASGAVTMTLPSSPSAGNIVAVKDYNGNFATANLTIARNGSPINGASAADVTIATDGASIVLVYVDATQGLVATQDDSSTFAGESFITATGGTEAICGDFKAHIFTGPGSFVVSAVSTSSPNNSLDYLVVGGGGGTYRNFAGGGGAGGMRFFSTAPGSNHPINNSGASPNTEITASVQTYPIVVGGGGSGGPAGSAGGATAGVASTFSTVTSAGGGLGGSSGNAPGDAAGSPGASGGGGDYNTGTLSGGTGNTPPTSPAQGNNGGASPGPNAAAGGGGASAVGVNGANGCSVKGGHGGCGVTSCITASPVAYAGGGGGAAGNNGCTGQGRAGGGNGGRNNPGPFGGGCGTANRGSGGGGGAGSSGPGGSGGSGIVVIRYKFQ